MIRVALADDDALIRGGLRILIDNEMDLHVVAEASDGAAALEVCERTQPDVVLMDLRMPGLDGIQTTRRLVAHDPLRPRVLVVTTFGDDHNVYAALRAGASGFIVKSSQPRQLIAALRAVAAGDALVLPADTRRLIEQHTPAASRSDGHDPLRYLTDRERQVLQHMAAGRTNAEISRALFIGIETVKTHVGAVLIKLGARDRTQAVITAYETGFVRPGHTA